MAISPLIPSPARGQRFPAASPRLSLWVRVGAAPPRDSSPPSIRGPALCQAALRRCPQRRGEGGIPAGLLPPRLAVYTPAAATTGRGTPKALDSIVPVGQTLRTHGRARYPLHEGRFRGRSVRPIIISDPWPTTWRCPPLPVLFLAVLMLALAETAGALIGRY